MNENEEFDYVLAQGGKLEYSEDGTTWKEMIGFTKIPGESSGIEEIDTTTMANKKYKSQKYGLMDAPKYEWELNLENPVQAQANIVVASGMEDSKKAYQWRITYTSGIIVSYKARVRTYLLDSETGNVEKFTMLHDIIGEPKRDLPTISSGQSMGEE